jgi:hypothetical protein
VGARNSLVERKSETVCCRLAAAKVRGEVFAHFHACVIIARVPISHFPSLAQNVMHTRCRIHRESLDSEQRDIKIGIPTQLREMLCNDSQNMLVLSSTVASRYYNCCTDGSTSP